MGPVLTDKALAEAMAAKAEIRRETSNLDLALRTLQRARFSFYIDYNEEPAPGETLRFIEKGFDSLRIRPLVERESAARLNASAGSRFPRAARGQCAEPEFLPLHGRKLRDASGHSARSKLLAVRGTAHCQRPKDRGEVH